jgi:hypothetical protein
MQDDSGEHCVGGASSGGASQDSISLMGELCMGSQVYDATALVLHDDTGCGPMRLALIGDGPLNGWSHQLKQQQHHQ